MPKGHADTTKKSPTVGRKRQQDKKKDQSPAPVGRPTEYSPVAVQPFLDRVAQGDSVVQICLEESMPSKASIYRWLFDHEEFRDKYWESKKISAVSDAEEVDDIGRKTLSGEYDPAAANVALRAKTWSAARKDPRRFAEKQQIEAVVTQKTDLSALDDAELATVEAILAKAAERTQE